MVRLRRPNLRTFSLVFAAIGLALAHWSAQSAEETRVQTPTILYPPAECLVQSNQVQIIVAGPASAKLALAFDGKPLPLERYSFASTWPLRSFRSVSSSGTKVLPMEMTLRLRDKTDTALWITTATLSEGTHALQLGENKRVLTRQSGDKPVPQEESVFHPHPGLGVTDEPISCSNCHDVNKGDNGQMLGRAKPPKSCETCHSEVDLRLTHSHVMEPLANCVMCHDPHGSIRPKLLLDTREKVCTQCHEAGHAAN